MRAGVPETVIVGRSKGEIALAELDRLRAGGLRFGVVLADAGYGTSARHGLDARGLTWAVDIAGNQKVYDPDVRLVPPKGRARRAVPDKEPCEAEAVLAVLAWRRVAWRYGTKGKLSARFAVTRVRVGDRPVWGNNRHLPGAEVWLVGERKCYLANLPPRTSRRALVGTIKARWVCEQAHQRLKEDGGLDHFEGRSWTGPHRHALMTRVACTTLQHLRLAEQPRTGRGNDLPPSRATARAQPAGRAPGHHRTAVRQPHPAGALPIPPAALLVAF